MDLKSEEIRSKHVTCAGNVIWEQARSRDKHFHEVTGGEGIGKTGQEL